LINALNIYSACKVYFSGFDERCADISKYLPRFAIILSSLKFSIFLYFSSNSESPELVANFSFLKISTDVEFFPSITSKVCPTISDQFFFYLAEASCIHSTSRLQLLIRLATFSIFFLLLRYDFECHSFKYSKYCSGLIYFTFDRSNFPFGVVL